MTQAQRKTRQAWVWCVSALFVAGCSSSPATSAPPAQSIDELIFGGIGDQATRDAIRQETIADCMRDEGWEYVPFKAPEVSVDQWLEQTGESRELWGSGIVYSALHPEEDLWTATQPDANAAIYEALSDQEKIAYMDSLIGSSAEHAAMPSVQETRMPSNEVVIVTYGEQPGCIGKGDRAIGSDVTGVREQLDALFADFQESLRSDSRIVALFNDWLTCMSTAGYTDEYQSYEHFDQAHMADMDAQVTDILQGQPARSVELTPAQRSELEELLSYDRAITTTALTCQEDYNRQYTDIEQELEAAFLVEREAEFTALAAHIASNRQQRSSTD